MALETVKCSKFSSTYYMACSQDAVRNSGKVCYFLINAVGKQDSFLGSLAWWLITAISSAQLGTRSCLSLGRITVYSRLAWTME